MQQQHLASREISQPAAASISALSAISTDGQLGQLLAGPALVRLTLSPAVMVHANFGDDNHNDADLAKEVSLPVTTLHALKANSARFRLARSFSGRFFGRVAGADA